ncbi:hypothetical protein CJ030_MR0G003699 [Morella rubra]|uniref:CWZF3/5/7 THD domain-containing protein n=1 Tax=Morella rubra TaxID=262757 RepID=A0A6A1ULV1_9ROSI|nr:hypothetical protein CJ030_MR0G003699 [Morella rubra]
MHYTDAGQNPDGLLIKEVQTDIQKYNESCSIDVKAVSPEVLLPSVKRSRKQVQKTIAVEDHCKSSTAGKKIKLKDQKNTRIHLDDLPSDRHITKDELISKEDASGKECRKEKAIESKFPGEETRKACGEAEERSKVTKIFLSSRTNNPLDCNSPYKCGKTSTKDQPLGCCDEYNLSVGVICGNSSSGSDLGVGQPCIAATSSSSMISGTGKTEVNSPKFEGSPAESVCSSPLRISNQENLTGSLSLDDGDADTGLSLINSHGRYSVGEGDGERNPSELTRKEKAFSMIQHGSSVSPLFDKPKSLTVHSSKITNSNARSDGIDDDKQNNRHCYEPRANHHFHYMERVNNHCSPNKSLPEKCRNSSSSRAKKRQSTPIFDFDKSGIRTTELVNKQEELETVHYGSKVEKRIAYDAVEDPYWKRDTDCLKNGKSARQNLLQNQNDEKSSEQFPLERTGQVELVAGNQNGGDSAKGSQQHGKYNCQKGADQVHSRHPTCNREGIKDIVPASHGRKDESTYASNNALKEVKDLKHSADCLKVSGSRLESTEVCFHAALKFLHGAALLDPHNRKSAKYGDIMSTAAYNTTAKLCEFCTSEYERCKDMASATLAYKCMEVAYMRVIYSNHFIASSDRHELQTILQTVSPVESPSSCASDADDLNNQAMMDKVDMAKDGGSSNVTGNHVISARTHPSLLRLLNFAQDIDFAMEASRKSQIAFAATNDLLAETGKEECISPIKRVLNLSFHDIDELLRLVRLAMEALSRVDFLNAK